MCPWKGRSPENHKTSLLWSDRSRSSHSGWAELFQPFAVHLKQKPLLPSQMSFKLRYPNEGESSQSDSAQLKVPKALKHTLCRAKTICIILLILWVFIIITWGTGVSKKAHAEIGFIPFKISQVWKKSPWQRPIKWQNI